MNNFAGKIVDGQKSMLLMESLAENFDKIEAEVAKIHSYDTFVLQSISMTQVSKQTEAWLQETLHG